MLNAWGDDLNSRAEEKKRSIKGKLASATHMQTVSYIKPLFKKLKRRVCDSDVQFYLLVMMLMYVVLGACAVLLLLYYYYYYSGITRG